MTTQAPRTPPKLAPPGAGIPFPQRLVLRFFIRPLVIRRTPWNVSLQRFARLHEKLKDEWANLDDRTLTTPALVPPQRGLEDSSRFWSVAQTARHLTIVGQLMEQVIIELSHDRDFPHRVSTADVKPEPHQNTHATIDEYVKFADSLVDRLEQSVGNRESARLLEHPWFGDLRARDWLWVLAIHTHLHLGQIREIKKALRNPV